MPPGGRPILAPDWHARMAGPPLRSLDEAIAGELGPLAARLARRLPPLRGLLAYRLAAGADGVALVNGEPGMATLLVLEAWLRRRRAVVVLELIPRRPDRRLRRRLLALWTRAVVHPAMRRALAAAQVLSEAERTGYAERIGVPVERVRYIPWPHSAGGEPALETAARQRQGVLSSGRAWCDWETLFAAARGRDWGLTVVCAERDRARVAALNRDGRAVVRSELSREQHRELLRSAAVYAVVLRSDAPSAGHVRLMEATDAGTPVVASDVPALAGYAIADETAVLVPPGDAAALRGAIERLLAAPGERDRLSAAAAERARAWTYREYFAALRELASAASPPPAS